MLPWIVAICLAAPPTMRDGEISEPINPVRVSPEAPCDLLIYVNGMNTTGPEALAQAKLLADRFEVPTRLVYNDLTLPVVDHFAVFWDKLWNADLSLNEATDSLVTLVREEVNAQRRVGVVAYSGGTIVTQNALRNLAKGSADVPAVALTKIHVLTIGSAVFDDGHALADRWPSSLGSCFHVYSRNDFVAQYFGPGNWGKSDSRAHSFSDVYLPALERDMLSNSGTRMLEGSVHAPDSLKYEATTADDLDADGIQDELEQRLLDRFIPVFFTDNEEGAVPCSATWFVRHCASVARGDGLTNRNPEILKEYIDKHHPPTLADGVGQPVLHLLSRDGSSLGQPITWDFAQQHGFLGMYGHVWRPDPAQPMLLSVQYYMLLTYNDADAPFDVGDHEGDFLCVDLSVRLMGETAKAARLEGAIFHNHGRQVFATGDYLEAHRRDGRIAVYLERGSNEPWPFPGGPGTNGWPGAGVTVNYIFKGSKQVGPIDICVSEWDVVQPHRGLGHTYAPLSIQNIGDVDTNGLMRIFPSRDDPTGYVGPHDTFLIGRMAARWGGTRGDMGESPFGPPFQGKMWRRYDWTRNNSTDIAVSDDPTEGGIPSTSPCSWMENWGWPIIQGLVVAAAAFGAVTLVGGLLGALLGIGTGPGVFLVVWAAILAGGLSFSFDGGGGDGSDTPEGLPPIIDGGDGGGWIVDVKNGYFSVWHRAATAARWTRLCQVPSRECSPNGRALTGRVVAASVETDETGRAASGISFRTQARDDVLRIGRADAYAIPPAGCGEPTPPPSCIGIPPLPALTPTAAEADQVRVCCGWFERRNGPNWERVVAVPNQCDGRILAATPLVAPVEVARAQLGWINETRCVLFVLPAEHDGAVEKQTLWGMPLDSGTSPWVAGFPLPPGHFAAIAQRVAGTPDGSVFASTFGQQHPRTRAWTPDVSGAIVSAVAFEYADRTVLLLQRADGPNPWQVISLPRDPAALPAVADYPTLVEAGRFLNER